MKIINLCCFIILCCSLLPNKANAQLLISPTKAIFEGRDRVKEIVLINTGDKTNTYRLGWEQQKQTYDGGYETLSTDEQASFRMASEFIRFSPRQVTLKPGGRQVVKMLLRKKSNMKNADYRSHLKFTVIPPMGEEVAQNEAVGMKLNVFINYSIPVVVRNGEPEEFVEISSAQIIKSETSNSKKLNLQVELEREGEYGSYGRLEVKAINQGNGEDILLGSLNGFNFLHENTRIVKHIAINDYKLLEQQKEISIDFISGLGERNVIANTKLRLN